MNKDTREAMVQDFLYRQALVEQQAQNMSFDEYLAAIGKARSATIKENGLGRIQRIQLNYILARHIHHSYRHYLFAVNPNCGLCGMPLDDIDEATIDHIVPSSKGGSNARTNRQLAHAYCNLLKGNRNIKSFNDEEMFGSF